jgi:hypothetical protein
MFGGNSNWRGPIWMPMNLLIVRALHKDRMPVRMEHEPDALAAKQFREPRVALTVPGVIIWPGVYAFQAVVLSNQGEILAALQAAVLVVFVLGAIATGLATARVATSAMPWKAFRDPFE